MPPNKNRLKKQTKKEPVQRGPEPPQSTTIQIDDETPVLTGNEENNRNIFIEMELPTPKTNLVVTERLPDLPAEQQVVSQILNESQPAVEEATTSNLTHNQTAPRDDQASSQPSEISSGNDIDEDSAFSSATLTKLYTSNGAEIFLIGTAHFSTQSVKDVQKVIKAVKPSSVILELCRERAFMLTLDEESLLEQNKSLSFEKVRNAIAEKGVAQGLIYIMFIKMSASLTEKLGLAPGAEFRAGSNEAQKIPGCHVVLADRSLNVTVARAVDSVSLWQKIKLIFQVLLNDVNITQEEVEKCKDKDMLEQLLQELGGEFPGFKRVILDERNIYLAHSIYRWAQNSETSTGPQKVVAIVGIGHVAGIVENWGKTTDEQIAALNEVPKTSRTRRIVGRTIKYSLIALLVYVGYKTIVPTSIKTAIYDKLSS